MVGRVVSTKMQKTAVVLVESQKTHPLYKKSFIRTKKYLVDDPFEVKDGDIVVFVKIRPISKRKHWQITKVLGRDFVSLEQAELKEGAKKAIAEVLPEEKPSDVESIEEGKGEVEAEVETLLVNEKAEKPVKKTKAVAKKEVSQKPKKEVKRKGEKTP